MNGRTSTPSKMADAQIVEALDATLPAIMMDARRAASGIEMGEHGRRRAGVGDAFWQYREWSNGESIRQVDWRRSAKSDKLFVRDRERQNPALLQIWCDQRPSMNWTSDPNISTKAQRSLIIGLALAIATRAGGERVHALGLNAPLNNEIQFARLLVEAGQKLPLQYQAGQVLFISDGLELPDVWTQRVQHITSARAQLIVLLIADQAELEFPFQGRIAFTTSPTETPFILGRAQSARSDYIDAYRQHMIAVQHAIQSAGGEVFDHCTRAPPIATMLKLAAALDGAAPHSRVS